VEGVRDCRACLYSSGVATLDNDARRALIAGGVMAGVVYAVPFLRFVFHVLITLVHELGHAIASWAFGIPAIPAFDFVYGGGVTIHQGRSTGLMILMYLGFAFVAYWLRENRGYLIALGVWVVAYTLAAFTPVHEAIAVAMGHGSELVFAGIFLYRALDGRACRVPSERPLYAFCAFFILLHDVVFALGLLTSASKVADYEDAKGGGHWMDFSRLAEEFLHVDLQAIAFFFLLACVLVPVFAVWAQRQIAANEAS
jgi:hypothetical protein